MFLPCAGSSPSCSSLVKNLAMIALSSLKSEFLRLSKFWKSLRNCEVWPEVWQAAEATNNNKQQLLIIRSLWSN